MIPFKQFKKTCLSSSCTFDPTKRQFFQKKFQLLKIKQKILQPQRGTFANRNKLGRLVVSEAKGRESFVFFRKFFILPGRTFRIFSSCVAFATVCLGDSVCLSLPSLLLPLLSRSLIEVSSPPKILKRQFSKYQFLLLIFFLPL